jgi:hypothetical protein
VEAVPARELDGGVRRWPRVLLLRRAGMSAKARSSSGVLHDSVGTDFEPLVGWEIMSAWGLGGTVLWQLLELVLRRVGTRPGPHMAGEAPSGPSGGRSWCGWR